MSHPFLDSLYDAVNEISERERSDLSPLFECLFRKLETINDGIILIHQRLDQMSDTNVTLDQAVTDLDAAVTANLAANPALVADAQAGLNTAADAAKVEGLVAKLNAETAADLAVTGPAPTPAQTVTVTGQTPSGAPVVDAPVETGPDAPTTQQVDPGKG